MTTSPRRKEWLFDESKFGEMLLLWSRTHGDDVSMRNIKDHVKSEIKRNRIEAVREFAEKVTNEAHEEMKNYGECCTCIEEEIEVALKDME